MAPTDLTETTPPECRRQQRRCRGHACPRWGKTPGHRGIPRQGQDHRRPAGLGVRGGVLHRPHPGPAPAGRRGPGGLQGRGVVPAGRGRRQRLQAALRGLDGEEVPGGEVEAAGQAGQRGLPGLGRGPRGRVHRLAPARGAGAPGAGQADGLPRDHPPGHRAGRQRVAGPRPTPGRRPGGPADPRPPLRLRGVPGPVEEDHAPAVGGRVQSVATRMVVERERARMGFRSAGLVGHRRHVHRGRVRAGSARGRRVRSPPPWWGWTAWPWPRAATSTTPGT